MTDLDEPPHLADNKIMASLGFDSLRQSVVDALGAVSLSTETVYQKMGYAFPRLVQELDASGSTPGAALSVTIEETLVAISGHEARFHRAQAETDQMLAQIEAQLASLGELRVCIESIREDSIRMELISLNAMVIAVRAGDSGRAFSCITVELRQLTSQTMELTNQIAAGEESLGRVFSEFKAELHKGSLREQKELTEFLDKVREVFEGLDTGTKQLWDGLERIRGRSDEVKVPLVKIIVEIQNQDRIRQSIDHVLLSLKEFKNIDETAAVETQLDELSFLEILPDLSSMVLDEISQEIGANRDSFRLALSSARKLMEGLEAERSDFITNHLSSRREGSLEYGFQQGQEIISTYVSQSQGAVRGRETAFRRSTTLQKNASDLGDTLRSFDFILSKFRNIDLASRIQVARQAALASMKDNASEMSELTHKIEQDVGQSIAITSEFFKTVQDLFQTYRDQFTLRTQQDLALDGHLQTTLGKLRTSKDSLNRSVLGARVFTQEFTSLFAQTEADLGTLDDLLGEIEEQKTVLSRIKHRIVERKNQVLDSHGLKEWKLESQKLKAMIDRFTIFTHKKYAAELGNFEVEQSVASGDVTLF